MSEHVFDTSSLRIPYTLTQQKRRSLAMRFKEGHLNVFIPLGSSMANLENWMRTKESWLIKSYTKAQYHQAQRSKHFLLNQEVHYVFKKGTELSASFEGSKVTIIKRDTMTEENALRRLKTKWAHEWILPIFKEERQRLECHPKSVTIKSMKSSWGRCTSSGDIRLSERLIDCDPEFIRYVCIHELAHLHEMNHSPRFWAWVEHAMPDYQTKRALTPYHHVNHSL